MVITAAVTAPTAMPIRLPRSAVWSISWRRSATAFVSLRRSAAISCRSSASLAIAQRLRGELGLFEGLLRNWLRALLEQDVSDPDQDCGEQDQRAEDDEECG